MSECFGKSWTVVLFSFVLVCCYMYAVHGAGEICTSRYEIDHGLFVRNNFDYIIYVKNVCLDMGRLLHVELSMITPTESCLNLVNLDTMDYTGDVPAEYYRFANTSVLNTVHNLAEEMFTDFNTDGNITTRGANLSVHGRLNIFGYVNLTIYRLLKTNHYEPNDPLINQIRTLKQTYCGGYSYTGLLINGEIPTEPPTTPLVLFRRYPNLRTSAERFLFGVKRTEVYYNSNALYVAPYEMAVTKFDDQNVTYIGSDGAGIGIIVILWHTATLAVGMAHINQTRRGNIQQAIANLIHRVNFGSNPAEGRLELTMIGGYSDTEFKAEDVFFCIMVAVQTQDIPVHLRMACVGGPNTEEIAFNQRIPRISGAVLYLRGNIDTGLEMNISPVTFYDRGPDYSLRIARIIANNDEILNFYNQEMGLFSIGPFHYDRVNFTNEIYEKKDEELDAMFGLIGVLEALVFLEQHRKYMEAFPNYQSRVYTRAQDESWERNNW